MRKRYAISEVLKALKGLHFKRRRDVLRLNESFALRAILKAGFDPGIVWAIPQGVPPYKPCEYQDQEARFVREAKKLDYFFEGWHNIRPARRQKMFIDMLETMDPEDAKMVISAKDKRLHLDYSGLTYRLAEVSFPGLLPPGEVTGDEDDDDGEVKAGLSGAGGPAEGGKPAGKKAKKGSVPEVSGHGGGDPGAGGTDEVRPGA